MEKDFDKTRFIGMQMAFQVIDGPVSLLPESLACLARIKPFPRKVFRMHAHAQHLLVIGTVENADHASLRQAHHTPP